MRSTHVFTLAGVPVGFQTGYLFLLFYFSYQFFAIGPLYAGIAAAIITVSLLVHEFGHAMMCKRYGLNPQVILVTMGGLCAHDRAKSNKHDALIVAAGPLVQIAFGVACWAAYEALGPATPTAAGKPSIEHFALQLLYWINIYWGLLNLLIPLWPLDGGQLYRLLLLRYLSPAKAEKITHWTGAIIGVGGGIAGALLYQSLFIAFIGVILGFENIRRINSKAASGAIRTRNKTVDSLLTSAGEAITEGDFREAARAAFQAKSEQGVGEDQLGAIWSILAISHTKMGEHDDAVDYAKRAPASPAVFASQIESLVALGRQSDAQALLRGGDAPKLPAKAREKLEALAGLDA